MAEKITLDQSISIFERMLLMRRFEEAVLHLSHDKHFFGHFHVYIGQEATGAATLEVLRDDDLILTTHRNHGHVVGRGAEPGKAFAEIMGRADGFNGGRGGTLHLCDRSKGFLSTSAVVGGAIGLSLGAAFWLKQVNEGAIAVAFFGDGSLEEGIAMEALNVAALYELPVLLMCENNSAGGAGAAAGEYPSSEMAAKIADLPKAFGIPTEVVDGEDVRAVYAAVTNAVERIRGGEGPFFIEAITERWPGTKPLWPELATGITDIALAWERDRIGGEHAHWIRDHDPVLRFARELQEFWDVTQDKIMEMDRQVDEQVAAAKSFAVASPFPEPDSAVHGVFVQSENRQ